MSRPVRAGRAFARFVLGLLLILIVWGFWLEPSSLRVQAETIEVPWPASVTLRAAVISDLHVGAPYYDEHRLPDIVSRTNATHPDVILLLGDFITLGVIGGHFVPPEAVARGLAGLRARYGVFAVLGNHDRAVAATQVSNALTRVGIRDLEDTAVEIPTATGRVWIVGISDLWTGPHDIPRALAGVTDSSPALAITHNPDVFPQIPSRIALTLAGHTHGGQVRLPLLGSPIVPSAYGQRYAAGHIVEGGRHLFVSTGIGTSDLPVRLGVPPTIYLLTITGPRSSSAAPRPARTAAPGYAPRSAPGTPAASSASPRR
jgi:uncharacterized protein